MAMHVGSSGGATSVAVTAFPLTPTAGTAVFSVNSAVMIDQGTGVMALKNGATPQEFRVYGSNTIYSSLQNDGSYTYLTAVGGTPVVQISASNSNILWNGTELYPSISATKNLGVAGNVWGQCFLGGPAITAGSGTGLTVNDPGSVRKLTHKVTVTFAALAAAATTADKTICTLPAKSRLVAIYADTTTKYIGGNISACALKIGSTVGGAEILASHDVFSNPITKGLADADLGTSMVRAAAIQGGYMPSFTANTAVSVRITTTSNNTNVLTQGSTTYYLETELLQ